MSKTISELQAEAHRIAVEHGFWADQPHFGESIALIHSEVSEALEERRKGAETFSTYYREDGKPEGIPSELADVVIRVMDVCGYYDIDLETAIVEKMAFNETRSYKHGKAF